MDKSEFKHNLDEYNRLCEAGRFKSYGSVSNIERLEPLLTDSGPGCQAGVCSGHYFHQDLLVANYIFRRRPAIHLDIGSRIDGFITHLLSFEQNIIIGDIRPLSYRHPRLEFCSIDLSKPIPSAFCGAFDSVSSLHAVEHVGLGRYGDRIDPEGHITAIGNLQKMVARAGNLYLSFPIGRSRVEFNSQRVLSIAESLEIFKSFNLTPKLLRIVDDQGHLLPTNFSRGNSWGQDLSFYAGCAIWMLQNNVIQGH